MTITIPSINMSTILNLIRTEPAVIMMGVNTAVALAVSWGLNLGTTEIGAVTIIATSILSIITALMARPMSVPVVKGGLTAVLIAFGAFHLHLTPSVIGSSVTAASIVLGLLFRANLTPLPNMPITLPPLVVPVVADPVPGVTP